MVGKDIFLSYASADAELARAFVAAFEASGLSVWWDRTIPPGRRFDEVIEEALNAARCVVVLWSKSSIESGWVNNEAAEAMNRRVLVPVLIEDVRLPFQFRLLQAARMFHWSGNLEDSQFLLMLRAVHDLVGFEDRHIAGPDSHASSANVETAAGTTRRTTGEKSTDDSSKVSEAGVSGPCVELSEVLETPHEVEVRFTEERGRREDVPRQEPERRTPELEPRKAKATSWMRRGVGSLLVLLVVVAGGVWWYSLPTQAQLVTRLTSRIAWVREGALNALIERAVRDPDVAQLAPDVEPLLRDGNESVRAAAAVTLGYMGDRGRTFAPEVARLLEDGSPKVRWCAARALGLMGEAGVSFAGRIARLLKDPETPVRYEAALVLGRMGKSAAEFAPEVAALLNDKDPGVRETAAKAVKEMRGDLPVPR